MNRVIKSIIIFTSVFILVLIAGSLIFNPGKSHKSPEEEAMYSAIIKWGESNQMDILSTYDFQEYKTITLKDEVEDELKLHNYKQEWNKSAYKEFTSESNNRVWSKSDRNMYAKMSNEYKDSIAREKIIIDYLESIKERYPDEYEKVTFTTYRLTYAYTDKDNKNTLELCFGAFDNEGNLVKFRPASLGEWEIIGDTCSIPNYNE